MPTSGSNALDRRTFMAASSLAAFLGVTYSFAAQSGAAAIDRVIDAHCHIFNGRDVPAVDFVLTVAAREQGFESWAQLAAAAAWLISTFAPAAEAESRDLLTKGPGIGVSDQEFKRQVYETLKHLAATRAYSPTPYSDAPSFKRLQNAGIDTTSDSFRVDGLYANPEALALDVLQRNYGLGVRSGPKSRAPLDAELASLANAIGDDASGVITKGRSLTDLGRYWAVVRIFDSYRLENVQRLDETFKFNTAGTTRLYCPAIIDYDYWLDSNSTPQLEQARMMAQVSKRTDANLLVHGYIAFDPLRAAIDKKRGVRDYETTLGVVRTAIRDLGFAGVKLYPPMGFRAWTNSGSRQGHGPIVKNLLEKEGMSEAALDVEIDAALDALYDFCLGQDVPILAHCSNSQTSFPESGLRASPQYWQSVLDRSDRHRQLRLNLGHFGNVWCLAQQQGSPDETARCQAAMEWPRAIVAMVTAGVPGKWRYPNLSFDMADLIPLNDDNWRDVLIGKLDALFGTGPMRQRILSRMMYGTDWMFLLFGKDYERYVDGMRTMSARLGISEADLMWRNAATFLGLTSGAKTADRLLKFHAGIAAKQQALQRLLV